MPDAPQQRILTVDEAAEWMRVGRRVILRAIKRGALPAARLGREWRIDRFVLEEALRNGLDLGGRFLPDKTTGENTTEKADEDEAQPDEGS